jgi:hypothetical protein
MSTPTSPMTQLTMLDGATEPGTGDGGADAAGDADQTEGKAEGCFSKKISIRISAGFHGGRRAFFGWLDREKKAGPAS